MSVADENEPGARPESEVGTSSLDLISGLEFDLDSELSRELALADFELELVERGRWLRSYIDEWNSTTFVWTFMVHMAGQFPNQEDADLWLEMLLVSGTVQRAIDILNED